MIVPASLLFIVTSYFQHYAKLQTPLGVLSVLHQRCFETELQSSLSVLV